MSQDTKLCSMLVHLVVIASDFAKVVKKDFAKVVTEVAVIT